jgi:hypothetical protein
MSAEFFERSASVRGFLDFENESEGALSREIMDWHVLSSETSQISPNYEYE